MDIFLQWCITLCLCCLFIVLFTHICMYIYIFSSIGYAWVMSMRVCVLQGGWVGKESVYRFSLLSVLLLHFSFLLFPFLSCVTLRFFFNPLPCLSAYFQKHASLPGHSGLSREHASPVRYTPADARFSYKRVTLTRIVSLGTSYLPPPCPRSGLCKREEVSSWLWSFFFPCSYFLFYRVYLTTIYTAVHLSLGYNSLVGEGGIGGDGIRAVASLELRWGLTWYRGLT